MDTSGLAINFSTMISLDTIIAILIAIIPAVYFIIQYKRQGTIDSIRFTFEYIDKMLNKDHNKKVVDILYQKHKRESCKNFTNEEVEWFLNDFENIMLIKKKKIISDDDIIYQFGKPLLKLMKKDDIFNYVLNMGTKTNDENLYKESKKFLKKF